MMEVMQRHVACVYMNGKVSEHMDVDNERN